MAAPPAEKIQVILEGSNRSSRGINVDFCKSIVVYRDEISDSVRQRLKTPTTNVALDLAPVWIFFYGDMKYPDDGKAHLKQPSVVHSSLATSGGTIGDCRQTLAVFKKRFLSSVTGRLTRHPSRPWASPIR
jgi:hypothetical protein